MENLELSDLLKICRDNTFSEMIHDINNFRSFVVRFILV